MTIWRKSLAWRCHGWPSPFCGPGSDARKSRRHIRALRRDFVDQLSRHPSLSENEFESLTYHHVSQLSKQSGCAGATLVITLGVVLLNCSHVVWQLRTREARSDPLARVRDVCISLLRDVMSERGVQQRPLNATLSELQRICDTLAHHHQPAAGVIGIGLAATLLAFTTRTGATAGHSQ